MSDENVNAANQIINTTQPKPLGGLIIRGQKHPKTIKTVIRGKDGADDRFLTVNEEDYDKSLHGEKIDKLPTKKKSSKKKTTKAEK